MVAKRKRSTNPRAAAAMAPASPSESAASPAAGADFAASSPTPPPVFAVDECPYKIEYRTPSGKPLRSQWKLGKKAAKPKKTSKSGQQVLDKNPIEDTDTVFVVKDANGKDTDWDSLKKYRNFVVGTETFSVDDYVFINHGNIPHGTELASMDDAKFWVARVLGIKAKDEAHVYLRVYWMYWPEELPCGRQPYHGQRELVASNHMEIVDAMTVSGRANVTHWLELDEDEDLPELFWRQKFDWPTGKLSDIRQHCACNGYYNPNKRMVGCGACGKWLHDECIIEDIKNRVLERGGPPEEVAQKDEDSIAVAKPAPPSKRKGAKSLFAAAVDSFVPTSAKSTPKATASASTAPPATSTKKRSAKELKSEKEKIEVTYNEETCKAHVRDLRGATEVAVSAKKRKSTGGSSTVVEGVKEWDEEVKCLCCHEVIV